MCTQEPAFLNCSCKNSSLIFFIIVMAGSSLRVELEIGVFRFKGLCVQRWLDKIKSDKM